MGHGAGRRIVHAEVPVVRSPSGLAIRHLVTEREGALGLFVGEQSFEPGDVVPRHWHPVEEVLTFLAGEGEATLGEERVAIGRGVSLYVPAGSEHGFRCTGDETLRVLVIFPTPRFAETTMVED
jgi:quercetin dioxygenase-like cupin family protein